MSFRVEVYEIFDPRDGTGPVLEVKRLERTVDQIDLDAVFAAVNKVPRKKREHKPKAGA